MSADSLRKQSKQGYHGQVILPQPINDLSLIESVAGFIHEVVPQAYSSVLPGESKDGILWARFDSTDYNDPENFPQLSECESESTPPLLLVLGYSSGVQVWSVGGSGEATELLSWCQGAVRALRFLLRPLSRDPHSSKRPLVAIVDSSSPGPQFATLSFVSLKTAEVVKIIKFNSPICDVHCNRKSIVVTFSERIAVFDSATLEDRLTITTCYPSPGNSPNPVALGPRWLAYGEKRLTTWQRSSGGCEGDGAQSYTSTVIHAAKSLGKGLRELGGSLTGSTTSSSHNAQAQPGIVSIIDIERKCSNSEEEKGNMVAHFVAHTSAVVAMAFDPSGLLLVTADRHGHRFNVFRIHSHPCTAQLAAVHHLYVLHRGETTARVQDITVSWDSRWVAVSSVRGTTHVFPITPYGGLVTVRTHTTAHVVNKLSRFERSAGLRDGRGSPLPCEAPSTPPPPRLPPYPHPSVVTPLAQLRARPDDAPLAAYFGPPRAWLPGRPKSKRTCADSLYIIYSSGAFMQYDLDPKVMQGVVKEKISFDTPIELGVEAKAEWILPKPPYTSSLCPPLPPGHVLLDLPPRPQQPPDKWLSQVEIVTHTGPHRRLWMGPQFTFKSIDPLPMSGGEDTGAESGNPLRSNPVNMPHRPFLLVEIGSGSPQMTEADEAGGRLKEDLADAMLETQNASGQTKGRLRRAEVEWQVNPLGAVQTHPRAETHWPHPIFFEPYSQEHYKATQQELSAEKTVEAALERIKLQEQFSDAPPEPGRDIAPKEEKSRVSEEPPPSREVSEEAMEPSKPSRVHKQRPTPSVPWKPPKEIVSTDKDKSLEEIKTRESTIPASTSKESDLTADLPVIKVDKTDSKHNESQQEDKSSIKQESEEKPKVSSKKNRKKRNGADKKTKKELPRVISEELPTSDNNNQSESLNVDEPLTEKVEELIDMAAKDIGPDITMEIEVTEELRSNTDKDLSLDDIVEIEQTCEPVTIVSTMECGDQDVIFPYVSGSQSIIACGVIEITEELSQLEIPPFEENIEIKVEPEPLLETLEEVELTQTTERTDNSNIEDSEILLEHMVEESPALSLGKALLEEELPLPPPLTFDFDPVEKPIIETIDTSDQTEEKDLNGNNTANQEESIDVFGLEKTQPCEPDMKDSTPLIPSPEEATSSLEVPISTEVEDTVPSLEQPEEEFITVPTKAARNKNRRKKKDKRQEEVSLSEVSEPDSSESVVVLKEQDSPVDILSAEPEPMETESVTANVASVDEPIMKEISEDVLEVPPKEIVQEEIVLPVESKSSMEDSLKSTSSPDTASSVLLSDDVQSDQPVSTDKSEVEDISSHSGKESDDPKICKKERSRKQKRSESSDKDRSELKKKSPSPATAKSDAKDSESSDEAGQVADNKQCTPKVPKRKKGKKSDEGIPEVPVRVKDTSTQSSAFKEPSIRPGKDKSSESSLESSSESRPPRHPVTRSWSHSASSSDPQNGIEDRDSVYESCNDDGASDSLAFESSKEDFDEGSSKTIVTEPSSSNTEEKIDSNDKTIQPLKKMRKQKKKKR